jgi:VPS62-like protein
MNKVRTCLMLLCGAYGLIFCASHARALQACDPSLGTDAQRKMFRKALRRHVPLLKFNQDENYFPLSVRAITNNSGNQLIRVVEGENNDRLLAKRPTNGNVPTLRITFLRNIYPQLREPSLERDYVVEQHGENEQEDYQEDAKRLQADKDYRDRVYGRICYMSQDGKTIAWLQYWFFYYYNDFRYSDDRYGLHEGDWEMVQIRLNPDAKPTHAVYAQHDEGSWCSWLEMNPAGDHPVVYVARGSHASYFQLGSHTLDLDFPFIGQIVRDQANGDGKIIGGPGRRFRLRTIGVNSPPWLNWEGHWGGTREREGSHPADADSPRGPKFQGHGKWFDPEAFYRSVQGKQCR